MKIDDRTSFGNRPSTNVGRNLVNNDAGVMLADSVTDSGEAMNRMGTAVQDSRDNFAYATAKNRFLEAGLKVKREVMESEDFENWEVEYDARMRKVKEGFIPDLKGQYAATFDQEADLQIARGSGDVGAASFKRETDHQRGVLVLELTQAKSNFITENNPGARTEQLFAANGMIQSAIDAGYISAEEGATMRLEVASQMSEGYLLAQPDEVQIQMLSNPESNHAALIAPDRRTTLLDQAMNRNKRERLLGESQAAVDTVWDPLNKTYETMLAEASKNASSAEARDAIRIQMQHKYGEFSQAQAFTYEEEFKKVFQSRDGAEAEANYNALIADEEKMKLLDSTQLIALKNARDMKRSGKQPVHNRLVYDQLLEMDRQAFQMVDLRQPTWFDNISVEKWEALSQMQRELKQGGNSIKYEQMVEDSVIFKQTLPAGVDANSPEATAALTWFQTQLEMRQEVAPNNYVKPSEKLELAKESQIKVSIDQKGWWMSVNELQENVGRWDKAFEQSIEEFEVGDIYDIDFNDIPTRRIDEIKAGFDEYLKSHPKGIAKKQANPELSGATMTDQELEDVYIEAHILGMDPNGDLEFKGGKIVVKEDEDVEKQR